MFYMGRLSKKNRNKKDKSLCLKSTFMICRFSDFFRKLPYILAQTDFRVDSASNPVKLRVS